MTIHENDKDRGRQETALFLYQRHLGALGVTQVSVRQTPKEKKLPWDAEIFIHNLYTTVVEVKCINYRSNEVEGWGHLMVKKPQIKSLRERFLKVGNVSKKPYWNKEVVLLVHCKDNVLFAINLRRVAEVWTESEIVPQEFVTTNHGKEPADFECRYIKLPHWERFE
jgi:hypothetical protein